jgi:hypothetical protein
MPAFPQFGELPFSAKTCCGWSVERIYAWEVTGSITQVWCNQ